MIVTDRESDRPHYSVCNNRPHVVLRCGLIIQVENIRTGIAKAKSFYGKRVKYKDYLYTVKHNKKY